MKRRKLRSHDARQWRPLLFPHYEWLYMSKLQYRPVGSDGLALFMPTLGVSMACSLCSGVVTLQPIPGTKSSMLTIPYVNFEGEPIEINPCVALGFVQPLMSHDYVDA